MITQPRSLVRSLSGPEASLASGGFASFRYSTGGARAMLVAGLLLVAAPGAHPAGKTGPRKARPAVAGPRLKHAKSAAPCRSRMRSVVPARAGRRPVVSMIGETAYRGSTDFREEIYLSERRIEPARPPVLTDGE